MSRRLNVPPPRGRRPGKRPSAQSVSSSAQSVRERAEREREDAAHLARRGGGARGALARPASCCPSAAHGGGDRPQCDRARVQADWHVGCRGEGHVFFGQPGRDGRLVGRRCCLEEV